MAGARISRNLQRLSNGYGGLGMLALRVGDLPTAAEQFARAAAINDSLGQAEGSMIARQNTGEVQAAAGDLDGARATFLEALDDGHRGRLLRGRRAQPPAAGPGRDSPGRLGRGRRQLATADSAAHARGVEDMRGRHRVRSRAPRPRPRATPPARSASSPTSSAERIPTTSSSATPSEPAGPGLGGGRRPGPRQRELTDAGDDLERWRAAPGGRRAPPVRLRRHRARRVRSAGAGLQRHRRAGPRGPRRGGVHARGAPAGTDAGRPADPGRRAARDRARPRRPHRDRAGDRRRDRRRAARRPDRDPRVRRRQRGCADDPVHRHARRRRGAAAAAGGLAGAAGRALRGAARERRGGRGAGARASARRCSGRRPRRCRPA